MRFDGYSFCGMAWLVHGLIFSIVSMIAAREFPGSSDAILMLTGFIVRDSWHVAIIIHGAASTCCMTYALMKRRESYG